MKLQAQLSDEQVARLRGTPPGEGFQWTDGRHYRVESNDGDQLVAYRVPGGVKLTLEFDEAAAQGRAAEGAYGNPRSATISDEKLWRLRSLPVGSKFTWEGVQYRVTSSSWSSIEGVPIAGAANVSLGRKQGTGAVRAPTPIRINLE